MNIHTIFIVHLLLYLSAFHENCKNAHLKHLCFWLYIFFLPQSSPFVLLCWHFVFQSWYNSRRPKFFKKKNRKVRYTFILTPDELYQFAVIPSHTDYGHPMKVQIKEIWNCGPMWQTKYASAVPKNSGLGFDFQPCSEGNFFTSHICLHW